MLRSTVEKNVRRDEQASNYPYVLYGVNGKAQGGGHCNLRRVGEA